jgi:two-component system sensor histidine kinase RegB
MFSADWDDNNLQINIRDFGSGISDDVKKQLGKPFFTSKNDQGMGLGVYLTQITLARFGGELSLNNHIEGGVVAAIKLPLKNLRIMQSASKLS